MSEAIEVAQTNRNVDICEVNSQELDLEELAGLS